MFVQRSTIAVARRAAPAAIARRTFTTTFVRREAKNKKPVKQETSQPSSSPSILAGYKRLADIKTDEDLLAPGAQPGTIPTDLEHATGLERLEILGKMEGIDIFDMRPLDASRLGTLDDPIAVNSAGNEQYVGCTGYPADSHGVLWLTITRDEPTTRCMECGSVYQMHYIGPQEDAHGHDHGHDHHHVENKYPKPKNMADFLKPEYLET